MRLAGTVVQRQGELLEGYLHHHQLLLPHLHPPGRAALASISPMSLICEQRGEALEDPRLCEQVSLRARTKTRRRLSLRDGLLRELCWFAVSVRCCTFTATAQAVPWSPKLHRHTTGDHRSDGPASLESVLDGLHGTLMSNKWAA